MKSLVIYFSHTGDNYFGGHIQNITKGNTEIVAEYIQEFTGADLFKVEGVKPYPTDYQECCDVALNEKNSNARPEIKKNLSSIDDYDIIYIGSPVWWGYPPMPLLTQLEKLDFSGKIVKPFTTHEGSGLGSVMSVYKQVCKGADIKPGLAIKGSAVKNSKKSVENWIKQ